MKNHFTILLVVIITFSLFNMNNTTNAQVPVTSGLVLHFDASDVDGDGSSATGEPANGADVDSWVNSAPGVQPVVNGLAGSASQRPAYIAAVPELGNRPALRFDEAQLDNLNFRDAANALIRITDIRTVFWVIQENPSATKLNFLLGDTDTFHFHRGAINGAMWSVPHTNNNIKNGVTRINGNQVDGLSTDMPTEHSIISVVTTGNVEANRIARDRAIDRYWDGDVAEVLIYNTPLNDTDVESVNQYLATKYSLAIAPLSNITAHRLGSEIAAVSQAATLSATVSRADAGTFSKVDFYIDGLLVGTDTTDNGGGVYSVPWTVLYGAHTYRAVATMTEGFIISDEITVNGTLDIPPAPVFDPFYNGPIPDLSELDGLGGGTGFDDGNALTNDNWQAANDNGTDFSGWTLGSAPGYEILRNEIVTFYPDNVPFASTNLGTGRYVTRRPGSTGQQRNSPIRKFDSNSIDVDLSIDKDYYFSFIWQLQNTPSSFASIQAGLTDSEGKGFRFGGESTGGNISSVIGSGPQDNPFWGSWFNAPGKKINRGLGNNHWFVVAKIESTVSTDTMYVRIYRADTELVHGTDDVLSGEGTGSDNWTMIYDGGVNNIQLDHIWIRSVMNQDFQTGIDSFRIGESWGAVTGIGPAETTMTGPAAGTWYEIGDSVTLNATATNAFGSISKVQFLVNDAVVGEDLTSDGSDGYSVAYNVTQPGFQCIRAVAYDGDGFPGEISAEVRVNVPLYVTVTGAGAGNGTSWVNAANLTTGVLLANGACGAPLMLEGGTPYSLTENLVQVTKSLEVYGSCAGTETFPSDRAGLYLTDNPTTITGNSTYRAFFSNSATVDTFLLDGLTITDCFAAANGAALSLQFHTGPVTLVDCVFSDNVTDTQAGAIAIQDSLTTVTMLRCDVLRNRCLASEGGAIRIIRCGDVVMEDCNFDSNISGYFAGAIRFWDSRAITLNRCDFTSNTSNLAQIGFGGAAFMQGGGNAAHKVTATDCNFIDNLAGEGGACWIQASAGGADFFNCNFINNRAFDGQGGALWYDREPGVIEDCLFENNYCQTFGGAIWARRSILTITNTDFTLNNAFREGGAINIPNDGSSNNHLILTDCTFTSNTSLTRRGGAIYFDANDITITGCDFYGNEAISDAGTFGDGGAISLYWHRVFNAKIDNCTFVRNRALGRTDDGAAGSEGGAIYIHDDPPSLAHITNCVFAENYSDGFGAAVRNWKGHLYLSNSTFFGNDGKTTHDNIDTANGDRTYIVNCLFDNSAGAIDRDDPGGANNTRLYRCVFGLVGTNNVWDATMVTPRIDGDPFFTNPAIYDFTIPLNSAARDVGINQAIADTDPELFAQSVVVPTTDLLGLARDPWPDAGALEYQSIPPVVDLNGAGAGVETANTFTEDGGPVAVTSPSMTVTDVDSTSMVVALITITNLLDGDDEILSAAATAGITQSYAGGVLTLMGPSDIPTFEALLATVTYENLDQDPDVSDRLISVIVSDGTGISDPSTCTMSLVAVNDPPDVTPFGDFSLPESATTYVGFRIADVTDVDNTTGSLTVSLDDGGSPLTFSNAAIDALTGEITADISAPLGTSGTLVNLMIHVQDASSTGSASENILVVDFNIPPLLTLNDGALAIQGTTPTLTVGTVSDPGQPAGSIDLAVIGAIPAGITVLEITNVGGDVVLTINVVNGLESGNYFIDIRATDLFGGVDTKALKLIVPGGLTRAENWDLLE